MAKSNLVSIERSRATGKSEPPAPRRTREKLQLIEVPPESGWFETTKDARGQTFWFLRVQITGMRVRRYGPFATKHKSLLFLDQLIDEVGDGLNEAADKLDAYQIKSRQFAYCSGHYPIVEDELIAKGG